MNLWRELRAGPELAMFMMGIPSLVAAAPGGDGHPVLVLPGFGCGDSSTGPLRHAIDRLGYQPLGWGQGINRGLRDDVLSALRTKLLELSDGDRGRVSVVGWSLGGLYAVALARAVPRQVRTVITLGCPHGGRTTAGVVPITSIYSRADQIVPWRSSLIERAPHAENVEVPGSHLGLGHNPAAFAVIADRLSQPTDGWRPFEAPNRAARWLTSGVGEAASRRTAVRV